MVPEPPRSLNVLILAGGQSSRMGQPKFLLPHVDGLPSYVHITATIHQAFPDVRHVFLLLHEPSQASLISKATSVPLKLIYDQDAAAPRKGPAIGLSKAMELDSSSRWLFYPCDYPLVTAEELRRLRLLYQDPVTCFEDAQGQAEPLISIWSPSAMVHSVSRNVNSRKDLSDAVQALNGTTIRPIYDHSLFNTNTPEDWAAAMALLGFPSKG